ncbi:endothelin-converting enzyme 2 [Aplysia californica]|uniref:Endothelin-converting enzyme 2 n=1 Tax=Aplysia californica TaxID=6500 RepID=A0ABM1AAZ7_APLCA|nr:endothelin-converting enzyme 2 [Aplysia californica]
MDRSEKHGLVTGNDVLSDVANSDPENSTTPAPPSRLRTRIMASGYKYKLLNEDIFLTDDEDPGREKCLHSVPCLRKLLLLLGVICVTLCIILIAVAAHDDDDDDDDDHDWKPEQLECTTPACVTSGAYILGSMNQSVEPCQDFYKFACGGWISKTKAPASSVKWDRFREVTLINNQNLKKLLETEGTVVKGKNSSAIAKLKTYYRTCVDTATVEKQGISRMLQAIDKLGSWTVTSKDIPAWNESTWTLQKSLVDMHSLLRSSLFSFSIHPDQKNNKKNVLGFTQSGLTLAYEDEYLGANASTFKDAYLSFATEVGILLGGNKTEVMEKMSDVYDFEKKLAEIFVPPENLTDPVTTYHKMSISEFQDLLGLWIDIKSYLIDTFKSQAFRNDEKILVPVPQYFKALRGVVEGTDKEVLANYMMWNFVISLLGYLPESFSRASLILARTESGLSELPPRWESCLSRTELALGFASSALYVQDHFSPDSKKKVTSLTQEIRAMFVKNLDDVSWMDDATKARLQAKAGTMKEMVGYPDWILDADKLDEYYEKVTVKEGELLENKINSIRAIRDRELSKYGKEPDRTEWNMLPSTVNAYYQPEFNVIVVPAGILQPPFFLPEFPDSFVYGTIGMILGHELSHGFDNVGRYFDENGNMADMWTPNAAEAFHQQSQCMVTQYDQYMLQGHHVKGLSTLGENIADNAGLKIAYHAYKASQSGETQQRLPALGVTDEQLFFLGFGQIWCAQIKPEYEIQTISTDVHSAPKIRVHGSLQNSAEFSEVYKCPSSSPYNSQQKCSVW